VASMVKAKRVIGRLHSGAAADWIALRLSR
jgi:hypothetical protein